MTIDIYTQLEDSLVDTVSKVFEQLNLNCDVMLSHQNGVEPDNDYCVINILRLVKKGKAQTNGGLLEFNNGMREFNIQQYETVVQLSFFGKGSGKNGMTFYSQYGGNTVIRETYLRNKLSPRRISEFRRNPQLRDKTWVDSHSFDMTMGYAVKTVQDIEWADYVTINNQTIPLKQ